MRTVRLLLQVVQGDGKCCGRFLDIPIFSPALVCECTPSLTTATPDAAVVRPFFIIIRSCGRDGSGDVFVPSTRGDGFFAGGDEDVPVIGNYSC
ncbi:hypothetical protein ACLOJK_035101 [Asimina triloba]